MTQPAGRGATVEFRFRNGRRVQFEAHEIRVGQAPGDVKEYLESSPPQLDWQKINIGDIGYRLVAQNQKQYLGRQVARWELDLEPPPGHFDKRVTVTTPLQKAGAYLLTAKMAGGNTSLIILWVDDTVIVKKPMAREGLLLRRRRPHRQAGPQGQRRVLRLADGPSRRQERVPCRDQGSSPNRRRRPGLIPRTTLADARAHYQWLITAQNAGGPACLSRLHPRLGRPLLRPGVQPGKVYTITDRPVYRPGQTVQFKFWVRHAQYDQADASDFADQTFTVEIHNPKGEKVLTKKLRGRRLRRHRRGVRAAGGRGAGRLPGSCHEPRAAARSASRSTRSPSSR